MLGTLSLLKKKASGLVSMTVVPPRYRVMDTAITQSKGLVSMTVVPPRYRVMDTAITQSKGLVSETRCRVLLGTLPSLGTLLLPSLESIIPTLDVAK
jgi:hypothetical protein